MSDKRKKSLVGLTLLDDFTFEFSCQTLQMSPIYPVSKKKFLDKAFKKVRITIEEIND